MDVQRSKLVLLQQARGVTNEVGSTEVCGLCTLQWQHFSDPTGVVYYSYTIIQEWACVRGARVETVLLVMKTLYSYMEVSIAL